MIHKPVRRLLRHPISQNVVGLYWVQVATFLVPLVTLPYISRVLGPSAFGLVIFAQGFSVFLTLLVDWGFTPYGVRAVASDRENHEALVGTVARIRGAQLLMSAASLPIAVGALVLVPKFHQHPAFLVLAWVAAVSTALTPNWYFVGVERVRLVSALQLGFRALGAGLTFLLVKEEGDAWIVLFLYMLSSIGMWLVCDALLYRRVPIRLRGLRAAAVAVRESGRLFIGTVGGSLMTSFNVVLLGLFVPNAQVAHFGASERIVRSSEQVLGPIGVAVYPRLTFLQASHRHDRARRLLVIAFAVVGGLGLLLALVFAIFAPLWIRLLFGHRFVHESVPILRILVPLIPLTIIGAVAATWLMTLHRDRTLVAIVIGAGVLNVMLACVLTPLFGPKGMACSVLTAQFVGTSVAMAAVYRERDSSTALFSRRPAGLAAAPDVPHPEPGSG
jgi:polysaccharide transporter, PST family